jgi:hypothetical protein
VNSVNAKSIWISQRTKIIIISSPIPDNNVIKDKRIILDPGIKILVKSKKFIPYPDIHDIDNTVTTRRKNPLYLAKDFGKNLKILRIVTHISYVMLRISVGNCLSFVNCSLSGKNIPVGRRSNNQIY